MAEYDPAGFLPHGLYDTTQLWDATGVKAKHCNNPVFPRWFPAFMYRGFGDPPFDAKAYPCAWQRNLPYNAWFPTSKWVGPAEGTPKWAGDNKPTGETWGSPWGPFPYGQNFFCVLEEKDGISEGSKSVPAGNWGNVYPKCFQASGANSAFDRLYFEAVNDAQNVFSAGKLDDVSEINRVDPFNRDPCGGRSSLAMLVPWALAVLAGVGTSIMLRYVVFDTVPTIALTSLSVGAAGFGWNFGQAIQAKARDRDYYVQGASAFLGAGVGVTGAVLAGFAVLPDWTAYEIPIVLAGAAGGYFFLAPAIEPGIGTGGGLLGSTLGFLGTIVGGIENFFCGLSNWDIDGCSPEKNETARSWDRVLLAAAAADSLAASHDLDAKEKEVAFQAMLVNAANVNAFETPTDKMETLMGFDIARSWTVGQAPPNTEDGKPTNSFANLGHVVQTELLPIEETQMQAWVQGLFRGQERNNKYMQTMFPKGDGALLQKCDRFSEIEQVPQFAQWMDLAYQAAQKGQLAPTRIGVPIKLYNCEIVYTTFLQFKAWQTAFTYLRDWERDHNKGGLDYLLDCKRSNAKLYYSLYAIGSVQIVDNTTAGDAVEQIDTYIKSKVPFDVQVPAFYQLLLASLGQWQFSSMIANDATASEIWRKWTRIAEGGVLTGCELALANIESGDDNWHALGARAAKYTEVPPGCTEMERGKFDAYKFLGKANSCADAVGYFAFKFQNATPTKQYECGVGSAYARAQDFQCGSYDQSGIDEWVAACSQ